MTHYNDNDGFDEPMPEFEPEAHAAPRSPWRRLVAAGIAIIAVGGFGGVVWYAYKAGLREGESGAVPIITAEIGATKIKPDDPGGMIVPHQDITAFERLDRSAAAPATPTVQALRPAAEEPIPRSDSPPEDAAPAPLAPSEAMAMPEELLPPPEPPPPVVIVEEPPAPVAPPPPERAPGPPMTQQEIAARPKAAPLAPIATSPLPPAAVVPAAPPALPPPVQSPPAQQVAQAAPAIPAPVVVVPSPVAAPPPAKAAPAQLTPPPVKTATPPPAKATPAPAAAAPSGAGGIRVQLGALPTAESAQTEWRRLTRKFPTELNGLSLTVEPVQVAGKGTYYRIQGGPLTDARARDICTTLTAQKTPCIVVRR